MKTKKKKQIAERKMKGGASKNFDKFFSMEASIVCVSEGSQSNESDKIIIKNNILNFILYIIDRYQDIKCLKPV